MRDEFASTTRNDALLDLIRTEINARGPVPFARFMELALYHPTLGYYHSGVRRIGERGDYVTSPHLSPIFGAIVGRQVAQVWELLGRPAAFDLVEMGAGDGRLMRDLLEWATRARPDFAAAVRPIFIEPAAPARDEQRRTLAHLAVTPRWVAAPGDLPHGAIRGCLLSNELVDSFPVRLFTVRDGTAHEVYVAHEAGELVERIGDAAADLPPSIEPFVRDLPDGARFEVNEAAGAWMRDVARRLARGAVLTFDYGYPRAQLYARWRVQGTLMAFYRHTVAPNPLAHPGEQDLTAHVDFTGLAEAGRAEGLELAGFTTQRAFLTALGIHDAVAAAGLTLEETLARRRAVIALTDPGGLGRVCVLAQTRGLGPCTLIGFAGAAPAAEVLGCAVHSGPLRVR